MAKKKIVDVVLECDGGEDEWSDGSDQRLTVRAIYGDEKTDIPVAPRYGTQAYWTWHWKYRNPAKGGSTLFSCYTGMEESCCAFNILRDFDTSAAAKDITKKIGTTLGAFLAKKDIYMSAYVPDRKDWKPTSDILEAAGFKRGICVQSNHEKYTVTRWEWIPGESNEKTVSTYPV